MRKVVLVVISLFLSLASLARTQDKPVVAVVDFRSLGLDEFVGQTIAEIIRTELNSGYLLLAKNLNIFLERGGSFIYSESEA